MINFTDVTAFKRLKQEEETNRLLKTLNTSVHHEMLAPLKANVEISSRLVKSLQNFLHEKKMAETILISSQMVMLHANDLLDQRIIENGSFVPHYAAGSPSQAILEMVQLIRLTLTQRKLKIQLDNSRLKRLPHMEFDKRRFQ